MSTKIDTVNKKWLSRSITKTNVVFTNNSNLTSQNSIDCSGTSYLGYNFSNTSSYMGIQLTANLELLQQSTTTGIGNSLSLYLNCGSPKSRYIKLIVNKTGTFNMTWTASSGSVNSKILYTRLYARVNGVDMLLSTYQKLTSAGSISTVPEWAHNGTYIIDTVNNEVIFKDISDSASTTVLTTTDEYENIFRAVIPYNWWDSKSTYTTDILRSDLFRMSLSILSSECVPPLTKLYPKYIGKTIDINYNSLGDNVIKVSQNSRIGLSFSSELYSGMKQVKIRLIGIPMIMITGAGVTLAVDIIISDYDESTGSTSYAKSFTWEYTSLSPNSIVQLKNKEFYIDIVNNTLLSSEITDNVYTSDFYKAIKK